MKEFEKYHPIVSFVYFLAVIGFSMFMMHPICLGVSFVSAFVYSVLVNGKRAALFGIVGVLPMMLVAAVANPLFSHEGVTVLAYLPDGNPLTLESVVYGFASATMLGSVVCWFSGYNAVMTSDKLLYLMGKTLPSLSMIVSMTMRFVPRFKERYRKVLDAQSCLGRNSSDMSLMRRIKNGTEILSAMITWMLESSIAASESMKSRGYGIGKRTVFSFFLFNSYDFWLLGIEVFLILYITIGAINGGAYFSYYPQIASAKYSAYTLSVFAAYVALCVLPIIIEVREVIRWNALKSKI